MNVNHCVHLLQHGYNAKFVTVSTGGILCKIRETYLMERKRERTEFKENEV
jgi:hypothetical protein